MTVTDYVDYQKGVATTFKSAALYADTAWVNGNRGLPPIAVDQVQSVIVDLQSINDTAGSTAVITLQWLDASGTILYLEAYSHLNALDLGLSGVAQTFLTLPVRGVTLNISIAEGFSAGTQVYVYGTNRTVNTRQVKGGWFQLGELACSTASMNLGVAQNAYVYLGANSDNLAIRLSAGVTAVQVDLQAYSPNGPVIGWANVWSGSLQTAVSAINDLHTPDQAMRLHFVNNDTVQRAFFVSAWSTP